MILKANIKNIIPIFFLGRTLISTGVYIKFYKNFRKNFIIKNKFISTKTICILHISKKK
ncbi:hypothetical protein [Blattabacterium cuenoti]|uniref:hypothetical protein n=1 Tax=Blattabacterium cuenoti TaxID=1653831 RepID=UPI001EEB6DF0|nr:hypothetical protein [Blattabacterium cuenoti]